MTDKRILIIDDDALVLKSYQNLLTRSGYQVIAASSYDEALKEFNKNTFDLIVSDIRMPGKNGVETVSHIQTKLAEIGKPDLPIIFITGYAEDSLKLNAKFIGEVLMKPVDSQKLLMTLRDYL